MLLELPPFTITETWNLEMVRDHPGIASGTLKKKLHDRGAPDYHKEMQRKGFLYCESGKGRSKKWFLTEMGRQALLPEPELPLQGEGEIIVKKAGKRFKLHLRSSEGGAGSGGPQRVQATRSPNQSGYVPTSRGDEPSYTPRGPTTRAVPPTKVSTRPSSLLA